MLFCKRLYQSTVASFLFLMSCGDLTRSSPLEINAESEEKLTNKINTLLDLPVTHNELSPSLRDDSGESNIPVNQQLPVSSESIQQHTNAALISGEQSPQDIMKHNSLESEYSEAVQKMIQNAKSPLVIDTEHLAVPRASDDQLSIGTFNRGESMAMLGTDELKTEKPETLVGTITPNNVSLNYMPLNLDITNHTQPAVTISSIETNTSHKLNAGLRFLASVSPEEFLKRLKKHLEISKSNLKILKKNFHDFVKEKEKLFRMNQKVSQDHPNTKAIKVSVIRADDTIQGASFVGDSQNSATFPRLVDPQPISKVCPHDCPLSTIHIDHHHHGNSPVPCICENDNLYLDMKEESSISDFEPFSLKSFKSKLTSNAIPLKATKSKVIDIEKNSDSQKSREDTIDITNQASDLIISSDKDTENLLTNNLDLKDIDERENIANELQLDSQENLINIKKSNNIIPKRNQLVNNVLMYYRKCDESTTHIPAICDESCVPCKPTPPSKPTPPCKPTPPNCGSSLSRSIPPGSYTKRDPSLGQTASPPSNCPLPTCPPSSQCPPPLNYPPPANYPLSPNCPPSLKYPPSPKCPTPLDNFAPSPKTPSNNCPPALNYPPSSN